VLKDSPVPFCFICLGLHILYNFYGVCSLRILKIVSENSVHTHNIWFRIFACLILWIKHSSLMLQIVNSRISFRDGGNQPNAY